jgi:hypothetical protein
MACQEFNHLEGTQQSDILSRYGIVSCGFKLDTWNQHRNPDGSYSDRCVSEVYVNFSNGRELKILCMICSRINVIIHENSLIIMCCNNTGTRIKISDLLHYVNQVPLETQALCSVIYETYELDNNGNLCEEEDVFHWQDEEEDEGEEDEEGIEVDVVDEVPEGGEEEGSAEEAEDIVNPFKVISYIIRNNIQGRLTDCDESLFYSKNKEYCESDHCKRLELDDPYSNPFGYNDDGLCKRLN